MKKAFLKKIVTAVVVATTMTTLAPLGVSAASNTSTNSYNLVLSTNLNVGWVNNNGIWNYLDNTGNVKTGWIKDSGKWYYLDNTGTMQTGVIKINNKTYCLNKAGALMTGNVVVNNKTYTSSSNGQVLGNKIPMFDKAFDLNNDVIKDSNKVSVVKDGNTNNTGTTTNTGAVVSSVNNTSTGNATSVGSVSTSNTKSTSLASTDVQGLPKLPNTYSISVQPSAEEKILELMNQKRVEAGLQPLTLDNTLLQVSRYKSNHMIQYNYFSHTTPEGYTWSKWLQTLGYKYTTTGENIAYNTYDAVELFNQWWNSAGHRANMMNPSFNKVGIGVVLGNGKYMGTQEFSN